MSEAENRGFAVCTNKRVKCTTFLPHPSLPLLQSPFSAVNHLTSECQLDDIAMRELISDSNVMLRSDLLYMMSFSFIIYYVLYIISCR